MYIYTPDWNVEVKIYGDNKRPRDNPDEIFFKPTDADDLAESISRKKANGDNLEIIKTMEKILSSLHQGETVRVISYRC